MNGYARLAAFMGACPEASIVRRFGNLQMENILYLQAELVGLEQEYKELALSNFRSPDGERKSFALDWYTLSSATDTDNKDKQWQLALHIRQKLKEYNEAVLQYHAIMELQPPASRELCDLLEWMGRPSMGNVYLTGRDRCVWKESKDLMRISNKDSGSDPLSRSIHRAIPGLYRLFHRNKENPSATKEFGDNTIVYSDSRVFRVASFLGTIIASLLPVMSIAILYAVKNMAQRIGLVAAFTTVFSMCLWFLTDGRMVEVFAATSAFAAVQVVFIGTNETC